MTPAPAAVVFLDAEILDRAEGAAGQQLMAQLAAAERVGVIANSGRTDWRVVGVPFGVDPKLVLVCGGYWRMPDQRAFEIAAVLAEADTAQCLFVSDEPERRQAAEQVGMSAAVFAAAVDARLAAAAADAPVSDPEPWILAGRVVTMDPEGMRVIEAGRLVITGDRITRVLETGDDLGPLADAPVVESAGTIYPGLIDLHNHFVYNIGALWEVPWHFDNRGQWSGSPSYQSTTSIPIRALAAASRTAQAIVRYVEAKALIGGTTTGQGILTSVKGGHVLFDGAMRNVERSDDPALMPSANTRVPDLQATNPEKVEAFRRNLRDYLAYFYHLSEGIDETARARYEALVGENLIQASLVGIHSLALTDADIANMAAKRAKAVWSPLSNLLLYGQTVRLGDWLDAGLLFSVGCDWSPTGSKNLLQEIKVARWVADTQEVTLADADLARLVTSAPAEILGWNEHLGRLADNTCADLLVLGGQDGDPYGQLVRARETDIELVVVAGKARFGSRQLLDQLVPTDEIESYGQDRGLCVDTGGLLGGLSFADAASTLREAMSDLHGFRDEAAAELTAGAPPAFQVILDNELDAGADEAMLAAPVEMAESIELDTPEVGTGVYLERLNTQANLPDDLAEMLLDTYA